MVPRDDRRDGREGAGPRGIEVERLTDGDVTESGGQRRGDDGVPTDGRGESQADRVEGLLYGGESVLERVDADGHDLVVTSHRVLLLAPEGADGPRVRQVERANVAAVRLQMVESLRLLVWSIGFVGLGTGLALAAATTDVAGMVPAVDPSGATAGVVQDTLDGIESLLAVFDLFLLVAGLLTIAAGLGAFGWYLRTRSQRLVVAVDGGPDLSIPRPEADERAVAALESAIERPPTDDGNASRSYGSTT
ncbi:hypothetical protein [Halovivax limisalsi]|uniref:hypothetical protein n=1 Tax=Halovivax limisalsi TaxID=1453760 RepID=UPI001FFC4FF9|nr:hypothetical protein [Halovivax limisalsi]